MQGYNPLEVTKMMQQNALNESAIQADKEQRQRNKAVEGVMRESGGILNEQTLAKLAMVDPMRAYEYRQKLQEQQQQEQMMQALQVGDPNAIAAIGAINRNPAMVQYAQGLPNAQGMTPEMQKLITQERIKAQFEQAGKQADEQRKAAAEATVSNEKNASVIDLIGQAEKIIPNASSGYIDRFATIAGNVQGKQSTKGDADAQLEAISAQMILQMPKMGGAMSDKDTEFYKQAIGSLADASIPVATRIQTLKQLKERYLNAMKNTPENTPQKSPFEMTNEELLQQYYKLKGGR